MWFVIFMRNEPGADQLKRIPRLYATEGMRWQDTVIYEHFFLGTCDWYASEYGQTNGLFFGFIILNDDLQNAEWSYFGHDKLRALRTPEGLEVNRDPQWRVRKASEVERIVSAVRSLGG